MVFSSHITPHFHLITIVLFTLSMIKCEDAQQITCCEREIPPGLVVITRSHATYLLVGLHRAVNITSHIDHENYHAYCRVLDLIDIVI